MNKEQLQLGLNRMNKNRELQNLKPLINEKNRHFDDANANYYVDIEDGKITSFSRYPKGGRN